jgi:hypothetical protein
MSLFYIEFNSYDHDFCEASIYNTGSEYINSISALFISFIGMFGLYYNTDYSDNIAMLYYSLIINGITSCIYHHTHYIGWGLLDRYSMIYISTYCYNIFISLLFTNNLFITHLLRLGIVTYLTILSTTAGLHNELMFNNLFGFFLGTILLFLISLRMKYQNLPKIIFYYGLKGITLISVAGISWIITENLCNTYPIMKYLFGHAIWHIAVSLGGYYISLIPIYLSKKPIFNHAINIKYKYNIPYISE